MLNMEKEQEVKGERVRLREASQRLQQDQEAHRRAQEELEGQRAKLKSDQEELQKARAALQERNDSPNIFEEVIGQGKGKGRKPRGRLIDSMQVDRPRN